MVRIPIGISNRHIHLCQIDADKLFGKNYQFTKIKELTQPGEIACKETVSLVGPRGRLDHVRVVLQIRKFTQVELMIGDTFVLWIEPVIRLSGNLKGTPGLHIIGPVWEVEIVFGAIVAKRHLHCTVKEAQDLWLENWQNIKIKVLWTRGLVFDNVEVRADDRYALDFHVDIEEANAAGLKMGDRGEIVN